MPDGALFLKGLGAAASAGALVALALSGIRRPASVTRTSVTGIVAIVLGLLAGCLVLQVRWNWPPGNGLDRWLTIVVPAAAGIELLAGLSGMPRWLASSLRLGLSSAAGRILLYSSVYLAPTGGAWTALQTALCLAFSAALLALMWILLLRLQDRAPGVSLPLALAVTTLCSGIAITLAGYVTGGKAALALAAALAGAAGALHLIAARPALPGAIGVGVVGLFGLLFVGRFFGGLSTGQVLVLMLAPLLCWATELPGLRGRTRWLIGAIRLVLVAIPLVVVVYSEKRGFDRHTAPLMSESGRIEGQF
jgi:hypothetical protein